MRAEQVILCIYEYLIFFNSPYLTLQTFLKRVHVDAISLQLFIVPRVRSVSFGMMMSNMVLRDSGDCIDIADNKCYNNY